MPKWVFFSLRLYFLVWIKDAEYLVLISSQHRQLDLILASVETFVTFKVSYRACVVLGAVLLQTSPRRGLSGGRMEAFLRAMREVTIRFRPLLL